MPDITKIKINIVTAVLAVMGIASTIFLAGGWFNDTRQMKSDISEIKALLIKMAEHDIKSDDRILVLERDLQMIKDYNSIRSSRGLQP